MNDYGCPSCGGRLVVTGDGVPNKHNKLQKLRARGMTCTRCGLCVNSESAEYAATPWWTRANRPPREDFEDSVAAQARTREDQ